jgi:hypothetical protein
MYGTEDPSYITITFLLPYIHVLLLYKYILP